MARLACTALALLTLLGCLGCSQGAAIPGPQPEPTPTIEVLREGTTFRDAILPGQGSLTWLSPATAGGGLSDSDAARATVQQTIHSVAPQLATVDYASLSLPDFVTNTRSITITEADFTGQNLVVEAYAEDTQGNRWAVYGWQGPELAQLPSRPLVHRWIYVYVLYDVAAGKVTRVLPTIRGEAHE